MACQKDHAALLSLGFAQVRQPDRIVLDYLTQLLRRDARKLAELSEQTSETIEAAAQKFFTLALSQFRKGQLKIARARAPPATAERVSRVA